jgi:hypothetical protein
MNVLRRSVRPLRGWEKIYKHKKNISKEKSQIDKTLRMRCGALIKPIAMEIRIFI